MVFGQSYYQRYQERLAVHVWLRRFWVFWGIYAVVLVVVFGLYALTLPYGMQAVITNIVALLIARCLITPTIRYLYKKQRPYERFAFTPLAESRLFSLANHTDDSFPSAHTISFATLSTVTILFFPVLGVTCFVVTLLTGWSRVVLGYHYPLDVLASLLLGVLAGLFTFYIIAPTLFT